MASHPVDEFVAELRRKLPQGNRLAHRVLLEVQDHLIESVESYRSKGFGSYEAEQQAVQRFGQLDEILQRFAIEAPLELEKDPMIRLMTMTIVALVTCYALLMSLFVLINQDDGFVWIALKLGIAIMLIGQGGLLFHVLWKERSLGEHLKLVLFFGGLLLVALGASNAVWNAHLGLETGDWEFYGQVGAILIMSEGVLSAWVGRKSLAEAPFEQQGNA